VWSLVNQNKPTEAPMSLTRGTEELFKVALPADNGQDRQRTFILATSPLVAADGGVDATTCVNSLLTPVPTHRRALRAAVSATWNTTSPLITGFNLIAQLTGPTGLVSASTHSVPSAMTLELLPNLPEVSGMTHTHGKTRQQGSNHAHLPWLCQPSHAYLTPPAPGPMYVHST
jgi:hypothetical protein